MPRHLIPVCASCNLPLPIAGMLYCCALCRKEFMIGRSLRAATALHSAECRQWQSELRLLIDAAYVRRCLRPVLVARPAAVGVSSRFRSRNPAAVAFIRFFDGFTCRAIGFIRSRIARMRSPAG